MPLKLTAPFTIGETEAIALCLKYSEDTETLTKLLARLSVSFTEPSIIPNQWEGKQYKDLVSLLFHVTIEGFAFPYYGSHQNAMDWRAQPEECADCAEFNRRKERAKQKRKDVRNGLLYSILCSIRCDIYCAEGTPEDIGMNPDSIKDMAKWNELKEHVKNLSRALKLTRAELNSLPS